ncbi:hypothetical protein EDB19DRAFT_1679830 [Suillus lakei]|nr:hypothetical protein EDB19DRAFT_1679830 [Suillus lakei]
MYHIRGFIVPLVILCHLQWSSVCCHLSRPEMLCELMFLYQTSFAIDSAQLGMIQLSQSKANTYLIVRLLLHQHTGLDGE